ncbi:MAG: RNA-binding protein [Nannocystaceae bacterium]
MRKIYVGNIPSAVTTTDIQSEFQSFGTIVDAQRLTDATGAPYGTVEFDNDNSAPAAITAKNGATVWGNVIAVEEYAV